MDASQFPSPCCKRRGESDLKALARSYVDKGRELLFESHREGADGLEVVCVFDDDGSFDSLSFRQWSARNFIRAFQRTATRLTVVAQGGYGRGELNPLFRYRSVLSLLLENLALRRGGHGKAALHAVGRRSRGGSRHAHLRNVSALAASDMKVKTALLDARFLCGHFDLYQEFDKAVESRLGQKAGLLDSSGKN